MKRRLPRACALILTAAALSLFTGCGFTTASVDTLLSPPKLSGEQSEIYQALQNAKGSGITLKYPKSGDYRSAFVVCNIDGEPTDEALVFYENTGLTGDSSLWVNFLDQTNGKWASVYDMPIIGSDIERVMFSALGDSGRVNIIIGYSVLNQSGKGISIVSYADGIPTEVFKSTYSVMEICDLDENGQNELLLVDFDKSLSTALASTYAWSGESFGHISSVALDPTASEYVSITKGTTDGTKPAVFLDHSKGDGTYGTDVLYCYGTKLVNPVYSVDSAAAATTLQRIVNGYTAALTCRDIDGDGTTELPGTSPFPAYESLTKPEKICAAVWYTLDSFGRLQKKYYTFYSLRGDYVFFFPSRWEGLVTVTVAGEGKTVTFWQTEAGNSADTLNEEKKLLTLKEVDGDELSAAELDGMVLFASMDDRYYYVSVGDGENPLMLTSDELEDSFKTLSAS